MSRLDSRLARLEQMRPPEPFAGLLDSQLLRQFSVAVDQAAAAGADMSDMTEALAQFDQDERERAAWDQAKCSYPETPLPTGCRWPHLLRNLEWWERTYPCRAT